MSRRPIAVGAAAALIAAAFLAHGNAASASETPSEKVEIGVNTVNGSGCRPGTAAVAPAPDNTAFTVTYSDFTAEAGDGTRAKDSRKNCQLNLSVKIPQGFTYAISKVDYRGYANLQDGATAKQLSSYYFQGRSQTERYETELTGPYDDNWQITDVAENASLVWAPCGATRNLNINSELRVNAGTSDSSTTSYITMDSTDASVETVYHFSWKKC